jgi:integrase
MRTIQKGRFHITEVVRRLDEGGKAAIREMQQELATPEPDAAPATFGERKRDFLKWYQEDKAGSSYKTLKSRLNQVGQLQGMNGIPLDDIPFAKLTSADILAALDSRDLKPNTRRAYRVSISAVYTREIKLELEQSEAAEREPRFRRNPASLAASDAEADDYDVRAATNEEIERLLAAAELHQLAYVQFSKLIGVRQGEFQHVRLKADLDINSWMLRIQKRGPDPRCTCDKCNEEGWRPKNRRGTRHFHIPDNLQELRRTILHLLEVYPVEENDFLFRNPRTGRPWTTKAMQDDFKALCERAEVPYGRDTPNGITWHSMRHACATNLVRAGVQLKVIADILGDTVETIEKYYVKLDGADLGRGLALGAAIAAAA